MENNEKEVLFSVSHLKKYFQVGNHATLKAVDDVSFEIYKGETLGMVGESGCGKTTCGRTCIGLYDKTDGQVLYKGTDVHALNGKERFAFKKQVQMVFQDPYGSLDPRMTVADIIGEGIDIHHLAKNKKERQEMIYKYLELVGLNASMRTVLCTSFPADSASESVLRVRLPCSRSSSFSMSRSPHSMFRSRHRSSIFLWICRKRWD